jgi:hypothetical protein
MWPFSKKESKPEPEPEIHRHFPIGKRFRYLGVEMIVCGHWEYWPHCGAMPVVKADYVDAKGQIRNVQFNPCELPALLNGG